MLHGVLLTIPSSQVPDLDRVKEKGMIASRYRWKPWTNSVVPAETYVAKEAKIDPLAKPYDWYLDLVVTGAEHHGLPKAYLDKLRSLNALPDPMPQRRERLEALKWLGRSK